MIHLGDIAYDLEDNNGTKGDTYFRETENIMANIPYLVKIFYCVNL